MTVHGHGHNSSEPKTVGSPSSKLSKKYHLSDIPKFIEEADGYKRPFITAERKKKMLCLNRPYRYVLAKQHKSLQREQVRAKSEQLKKLYVEHQAQRVASNHARWLKISKKPVTENLQILKPTNIFLLSQDNFKSLKLRLIK